MTEPTPLIVNLGAHLPTPRRRRRLHGRRGHSRRCTAPHEVCWVRSDTRARHRDTGHADTHSPAAVPTHGKYTFLDKNRRDIGESQSEQAQPQQPQQLRSRTWAACPPAKARGRNHRRRLQCRPHHPKTEATATAGVSSRRVPIPPEPFLDRNRRDIGGSQPNTGHTSHSTHTRLAAQRPGTGTHHVVQRRTRRRHTPHLRRAGHQD
eukprot:COSAG01_NODE_1998_length_8689_cov_36.410943_3_plen_207_part_00